MLDPDFVLSTSKMQVTITYQPHKLHRGDMALLNYGFLPKRRPPLLCAHDLGSPEAVRPVFAGPACVPNLCLCGVVSSVECFVLQSSEEKAHIALQAALFS